MKFRGKEGEKMAVEGRMEKFCEEYIVDYNAYKAAIRAGYAKNSARSHSYQLLKREDVTERIRRLQEDHIKKNLLDSRNRVLREYWAIYERATQAQPVTVWDKELKEYVETGEYQFDSKTAMTCLEFIAKLGGMLSEKKKEKAGDNFELVVKVEKDEN